MKLSRRALVTAGAKAGATAAAIGLPRIAGAITPLVVYDSRVPASRHHALVTAGPKLDIASLDPRWSVLRAQLPDRPIAGMLRWHDYVMVRGYAGEQRRRVRDERIHRGLVAFEIA